MAVDIVLNPVPLLDDGSSNVYINYLTMELGTWKVCMKVFIYVNKLRIGFKKKLIQGNKVQHSSDTAIHNQRFVVHWC